VQEKAAELYELAAMISMINHRRYETGVPSLNYILKNKLDARL
jgi:hypothetical protein